MRPAPHCCCCVRVCKALYRVEEPCAAVLLSSPRLIASGLIHSFPRGFAPTRVNQQGAIVNFKMSSLIKYADAEKERTDTLKETHPLIHVLLWSDQSMICIGVELMMLCQRWRSIKVNEVMRSCTRPKQKNKAQLAFLSFFSHMMPFFPIQSFYYRSPFISILTNHISMASLFIQLSDDVYNRFLFVWNHVFNDFFMNMEFKRTTFIWNIYIYIYIYIYICQHTWNPIAQ